MTTSPRSPRLLKGALVAVELGRTPRVIAFQYNPATLSRTLEPRLVEEAAGGAAAPRLRGAPVETISLEVEIDAADQLERAEGSAVRLGVYPQISALETLLYPPTNVVVANTALLALGTLEVVPPVAPLILFIWGPRRVVPVRLNSFGLTEEAFDVNLNPVRARVSLGLRVLSYSDLRVLHPGYHLFMAHQVVKEAMAVLGTSADLSSVIGGDVNLLWRGS